MSEAEHLAATLIGLGLIDALNPFSIAALVYLLATPRPLARCLTFLAGTYLTYFAGGLALLYGLNLLISELLPRLPAWSAAAGQMALGGVCLVLAITTGLRSRAGKPAFSPPTNLSIGATALFAIASTATDVPTAAPYVAATALLNAETSSLFGKILWLALYNLVYATPLIALIVLHVVTRARAALTFKRIQRAIDWAFARLTPTVLTALGVWLLWRGGGSLA